MGIETAFAIGSFLGFIGTAATVVGYIAIGVTMFAASKLLAPDIPKFGYDASSASRGALLNKDGTSEAIPVIYGQRRIGGTRIFLASNGTDNKKLHLVLSICEGPIEGFDKIYFQDELAATSNDGGATWTYVGSYSGKLVIKSHKGDQIAAEPTLVSENVGWTNNHIGYGIAYLYLELTYDQDVYPQGLPTVTALIRGKKTPALGSEWNQNLAYSSNPTDAIYDYLINPNYGKGIPVDLIDTASFQSSKDYCAETVTNSDDTTETRYLVNGYVSPDARLYDNIVELLQSCRGFVTSGNKYQLNIDRPVNTGLALRINDDNIIGNVEFTVGSKRSLFNTVRAKINNENTEFNYKEDFMIVSSEALIAADGVKLTQELVLPHTTSATMAERMAIEEINASRQSGQLRVTTTTALFEATVGDVVKFSNDTLAQTDKLYRIINQVITNDHKMELSLVEYDNNVYWDNNPSIIINNKDDFED